jgi:hypothetical protein
VPLRYELAHPRERPRGGLSRNELPARLTAPLLGSRFLFPARFDAAVQGLLDDPTTATPLPPAHARWYFGPALTFTVDPAALQWRISDVVKDGRGFRWIGASFLDGADWSDALAPLDRSPVHREMRELVDARLDFRATRSYRVLSTLAESGKPVRRSGVTLTGPAEIDAYFRYCTDLVKSMRKHGIIPRGRLDMFRPGWLKHRAARPAAVDGAERNVGVAIDADGTVIRCLGGKHRTAVAKALGLRSMPVELRCVHVGWLAGMTERTGLPAHAALKEALRSFKPG